MDVEAFMQAQLAPRQEEVPVPELAEWFAKGQAPVWVVRGLAGAELGRANEAADNGGERLRTAVAALAGEGTEKASALKALLGVSDDEVPKDISRRIELLTWGSVAPALGANGRDVAVRLAEAFPVTFYTLTNRILNLTGKGSEPGKAKRSSRTQG